MGVVEGQGQQLHRAGAHLDGIHDVFCQGDVAAVRALDALGLAGGASGVEDLCKIIALREGQVRLLARGGLLQQLVEAGHGSGGLCRVAGVDHRQGGLNFAADVVHAGLGRAALEGHEYYAGQLGAHVEQEEAGVLGALDHHAVAPLQPALQQRSCDAARPAPTLGIAVGALGVCAEECAGLGCRVGGQDLDHRVHAFTTFRNAGPAGPLEAHVGKAAGVEANAVDSEDDHREERRQVEGPAQGQGPRGHALANLHAAFLEQTHHEEDQDAQQR